MIAVTLQSASSDSFLFEASSISFPRVTPPWFAKRKAFEKLTNGEIESQIPLVEGEAKRANGTSPKTNKDSASSSDFIPPEQHAATV